MNLAKEVEKLREQLAALQQKDKCYIVWHDRSETQDEAIEAAIQAGRYDPDTQDAVIIISHIPMKTTYHQGWSSELPESPYKRELEEVVRTSPAPRFEGSLPDPPKPREERRSKIHYPDGTVPY
jgi:hypothetical protein